MAEVKIELGNLNVNQKYGTLILHEDQRSTARPADSFLNIDDSSKIIFHVVLMLIVSEYFLLGNTIYQSGKRAIFHKIKLPI